MLDRPPPPNEEQLLAGESIGLTRETQMDAWRAQVSPFAVWPENWDAVVLFEALATQWRLDAMGREYGLDYAAVPVVQQTLRMRGRRARSAFRGLQVMEVASLNHRRRQTRPH